MVQKGEIEEILSKAMYVDSPELYMIYYRDFNQIVEKPLPDFLKESENLQTIPISRIEMIKKNNTILFEKRKKINE